MLRSCRLLTPCLLAVAFGLLLSRPPVFGQVTEATTGRITSNNWLALGPFANPFGCSTSGGDLLTNHLAPSFIHCLYPTEGDTIEYDTAQASSTAYVGPLIGGKPAWRIFDDGVNDGRNILDSDLGGDLSDVMTWLVTYVEYLGATPGDFDLCVSSDDGVQLWLDDRLIHNNPACRGDGACDDVVVVTIPPGLHRFAIGTWERGGGWACALAIREAGVPIEDTHPDWVFLGTDSGGLTKPCVPLPQRTTSVPSDPTACPPEAGGPITVNVKQSSGAAGEVVLVTERALGSFGKTVVTADNGGAVSDLPQAPISPLGMFGDARHIFVRPDCTGEAGESFADFDNGGTPGDPSDDSYTLATIGEDIWANGDSFMYAYNLVKGDFVMTAHVANRIFVPGSRWGKHGIMARQDSTTRSRYSWVHDHGEDLQDNSRFAARATHGGSDNFEPASPLAAAEHADWLRLERVGSMFNGYSSPDGSDGSWVLMGTLDWGASAPATVMLGLAVTSHTLSCLDSPTTITFDNVELALGAGSTVEPMVLLPLGVEIKWNVARSVLQSAGVSYVVNVHRGLVNFEGDVAGTQTIGSGSRVLIEASTQYGPFADPPFTLAHGIGTPCPGTSITNPSPGTLVIAGAGVDIWSDTGDHFMYAYREVTGDFSARVTITDRVFAPGSRWGKHGIMARQDCGFKSRYAFMHDHGEDLQDVTRFAVRPNHGAAGNFELTGPLPGGSHYDTLRLDRCGSEFIGYVRDDLGLLGTPGAWVEVGRNNWGPTAPAAVQVGLAVTSHAACNVTTITFEDWELRNGCEGPVEDLTCTENQTGGLDLTWKNSSGADPGVNISVQVNGAEFRSLPGTATSTNIPATEFPAGQISEISVINSSTIAAICNFPPAYSTQGFIKDWLLLGPYRQPGALTAANPGDDAIRMDHLRNADGSIRQETVEPKAGDTVNTDYGPAGTARSLGLAVPAGGNPNNINPGNIPTWYAWNDKDDTIDFNDYYGGDVNTIMMHAVTYINVEEDIVVDICYGSDDSFQLLLDGVEIAINNVARPPGAPNECQNVISSATVPQLNPLPAGVHQLMVKVFEGGGLHAFRLRFQDPTSLLPIIPGTVCLIKSGCGSVGPRLVRGDSNADGRINITDPIYSLAFSFQGGPPPPCRDAADADDSFGINITDPIYLLSFLFQGGSRPPAPSPSSGNYVPGDCGLDTTADNLDCLSFPPCN